MDETTYFGSVSELWWLGIFLVIMITCNWFFLRSQKEK